MDPQEIRAKFKRVSDEVESNASQLEQDVRSKVAVVRDDTVKKFTNVVSS
jgi:hypothetical protein